MLDDFSDWGALASETGAHPMNLNFLSGLLLATVTIAIIVFVLKELLGDRRSRSGTPRQPRAHVRDKLSGAPAKPVNAHLIGSVGEVITHSEDNARPMRIRVGPELWPARLESTDETPPAVGERVRVVAVEGPVLVVAAAPDASEPPSP